MNLKAQLCLLRKVTFFQMLIIPTQLIRLDDVRPFVMAPFDQVRNTLAQELVQQRRQQAVGALLKDAKVVKGS
jgi:hypothetical protein